MKVAYFGNRTVGDDEKQALVDDVFRSVAERYDLRKFEATLFAVDGGLISYAPDEAEMYRQAAGYVDRILRGENAADLPVQAPTRYETVLTAKALGLDVPAEVLVRADEVIE
jgi:putative ABC transport system substrate-binding protein